MARILGIDYGLKRTGLAWTDPLQMIATALDTVDTPRLEAYLQDLVRREAIEAIVLGFPTRPDGRDTDATAAVRVFADQVRALFPDLTLHLQDERFSSRRAMEAMIAGGVSKKRRRDKQLINAVSATLILQDFLQEQNPPPLV
ncbi:MAG: Holliday junction resolvase RuvX [Bacteroidetes bacterium]|nr:MAG: Holliday junction resolvase RuvX [Bacteroidota bacterium]